MANNVTAQVLGGAPVIKNADTVTLLAEIMALGTTHSVKVNGKDADYSTSLNDYDFVSFGTKVKGGLK